jgi:hypothetical protein
MAAREESTPLCSASSGEAPDVAAAARALVKVDPRCPNLAGGDARVRLSFPLDAPPPQHTVLTAHGLESLEGAASCCPQPAAAVNQCLRACLLHARQADSIPHPFSSLVGLPGLIDAIGALASLLRAVS